MTKLPPPEQPRRVLMIEDDPLERMLLHDRLRREGLELKEAHSGRQGLEIIIAERPDLVLLDLGLPDLCGLEVIRRMKEDPTTRSIPVVVLSGTSDTLQKVKALDLGAVDFVTKPYEPIELRARIRTALRTKYLTDLLEQQAQIDALTGLANRHALFERFEAECESMRRRQAPLSVLIADLDHFKAINDRYGHTAGDVVLRSAAKAFREVARRGDLVSRFGGEEFVVLAPDCDSEGSLMLASRVKEAISTLEIYHDGQTLSVTTSVGAVTINDPASGLANAENPFSLLRKADLALYSAKRAGRNAIYVWSDAHDAPVTPDSLRIPA